jgi:hypothetical protein
MIHFLKHLNSNFEKYLVNVQFNSWGPLRPMILYFIIYQFEDTKGVIQTCKSKKDRKHYDQKKKDKNQIQWTI